MAKTNWQMGDTVLPSDLNLIGQEINDNAAAIADHAVATTGVHGATTEAAPNTIVQRDAYGRFKAGVPAAADDVARLAEINGISTQTINVIPTRNASVPATDYPVGITTLVVSDANAGWPETTGQVITFKPAGYRTTQIFASHKGLRNYFRRWDAANEQWMAWQEFPTLGTANTFVGVQRFQVASANEHAGIALIGPSGQIVGAYYYHFPSGRVIMRKHNPDSGEIEADLWFQATELKYRVGSSNYTSYDIWHSGNLTYETGTWTPTLEATSGTWNHTYSTQHGRYVRYGNLVFIWGQVAISAKDPGMGGNVVVRGIPFRCANDGHYPISIGWFRYVNMGNSNFLTARVDQNSNQVSYWENGNNVGDVALPSSKITSTTTLAFGGVYKIA